MATEKITIDCTPTWSALLPVLLDLYAQFKNEGGFNHAKKLDDLKREFENMALAADKWNEHYKAS